MTQNNNPWSETFKPYINAVKKRFVFLEKTKEYEAPKISIGNRECSIVYWGLNKVNIAFFHDLGSPSNVFIIPLLITREDGSTRSFGLLEVISVLDSEYLKKQPASPYSVTDYKLEGLWLDWYAGFLKHNLKKVISPSLKFICDIEAKRKSNRLE